MSCTYKKSVVCMVLGVFLFMGIGLAQEATPAKPDASKISLDVKGMKPQFNIPQSQGFGSVVAAQQDLQRRLEELERQMGR